MQKINFIVNTFVFRYAINWRFSKCDIHGAAAPALHENLLDKQILGLYLNLLLIVRNSEATPRNLF